MNKEALYYAPQAIYEFDATVLTCEKQKKGYAVTLSQDGFYPEGGGQPSDQGTLKNEKDTWQVLDVKEGNPNIHWIDHFIEIGSKVHCEVDQKRRFRLSQNHSGEHIVSGIVHKYFTYENVGFHMESQGEIKGLMTIDFNGVLSFEHCKKIEKEANEEIWKNTPITIVWNPDESVFYRSKKELNGDIRIVKIGDIDSCACCGTHVESTGQIGLIKILSCQPHRSGSRLTLLCGMDAYQDTSIKEDVLLSMTQSLSVSPYKGEKALERLQNESLEKTHQITSLNEEIFSMLVKEIPTCFAYALFLKNKDSVTLRKACDSMMHQSLAELIFVGSVEQETIRFSMGSTKVDVRPYLKQMQEKLTIRGGGQKEMVQGTIQAGKEEVELVLKELGFYGC